MKKVLLSLMMLMTTLPAIAEKNIMFGDKNNSMTLYVAQSTGSGSLLKLIQPGIWDFTPQTFVMLQYSQPMKFFRLDSKLNLNITENFGYKSSTGLGFFSMGISIDTALLQYHDWYMGLGIGPYMRDNMDRWVESRLVFGEKFFIGKNINENWHIELFTIHFSNGNFTQKNEGFNFAGLSIGYKF
ncbi:MAG: acyloxyacyl hydrolase [Alphaproteobacteria bacterium]|nr:acyloxyacyl hydrolase [Alphaproteobacteria bacterium]